MPLIPYHNSLWNLDDFFDEEKFFVKTPRVDVYETTGKVMAEIELPGVDPKNIEIEVSDNTVRIRAKNESKEEEKKKGYYRKEISKGYYERIVPLPVQAIGDKAKAVYKEGILKIAIPKVKSSKEKKTKKVKIPIENGKRNKKR